MLVRLCQNTGCLVTPGSLPAVSSWAAKCPELERMLFGFVCLQALRLAHFSELPGAHELQQWLALWVQQQLLPL